MHRVLALVLGAAFLAAPRTPAGAADIGDRIESWFQETLVCMTYPKDKHGTIEVVQPQEVSKVTEREQT